MELIGMSLVTFDLLNTSLIQNLKRWKALLFVREQLGLLVIIHLLLLLPHILSEQFLWNGWTDHDETS
jgi:hypothetical protein